MVDFVHVAQTDKWLQRPGPQTTVPVEERKVVYLNEMSQLGDQPYEAVIAPAVQSAAPESGSTKSKEIVQLKNGGNGASALIWPKTAWEERRALPFVTAGVGALLVAPLVMPGAAFTGYLLAGYGFGIVSQWIAQREIVPQEPQQPIERFIASKAKNEEITQKNPVLDISDQPSVSLQQQIADQQGAF